MSPLIRDLFEDAADDGGRPLVSDLAAIRAAGRRGVLRRRLVAVGSGVAVAAVVGSVAVAGGLVDLTPDRGGSNIAADGGRDGDTDLVASPGGDSACGYGYSSGSSGVEPPLPVQSAPPPEDLVPPDWPTGEPPTMTAGAEAGESGVRESATDDPGKSEDGDTAVEAPGQVPPVMPSDDSPVLDDPGCEESAGYPGDQVAPVLAALMASGYRAEDVGGMGAASDGSDGGQQSNHTIVRITDKDGHVGSAVLGIYSSIDATSMFDLPGHQDGRPWCAPTFSDQADFQWDECAIPAEGPAIVITKGRDGRGEALGATLVRANGSIIGISVSTAWYGSVSDGGEESDSTTTDDTEPLEHLPLTEAQLTAILKAIEGTLSAN
jgi:hypothetical protein